MKAIKSALLGIALLAAATAVQAQNEQFIPILSYRVGPVRRRRFRLFRRQRSTTSTSSTLTGGINGVKLDVGGMRDRVQRVEGRRVL